MNIDNALQTSVKKAANLSLDTNITDVSEVDGQIVLTSEETESNDLPKAPALSPTHELLKEFATDEKAKRVLEALAQHDSKTVPANGKKITLSADEQKLFDKVLKERRELEKAAQASKTQTPKTQSNAGAVNNTGRKPAATAKKQNHFLKGNQEADVVSVIAGAHEVQLASTPVSEKLMPVAAHNGNHNLIKVAVAKKVSADQMQPSVSPTNEEKLRKEKEEAESQYNKGNVGSATQAAFMKSHALIPGMNGPAFHGQ